MNKILLAFVVVFYSLNLNARGIPVNFNSLVNKGISSLVTLPPAEYQSGKDFGDAPISYGSADHGIDLLHYMGSRIDQEPANQPSPFADADDKNGIDDEDGVIFPVLTQGATSAIPVTLVGNAFLNVWIDWNGDGDFGDSGERILTDLSRGGGLYNLSVTVPANAITSAPTFARFRYGPRSTIVPTYGSSGSAAYGEVEDYLITILCAPPAAPSVGTRTHPTCTLPTGSVVLNGLPSTGTWVLTRMPGVVVTSGSGTSTTSTGLLSGTYTYTVTNASGCISGSSANVIINPQPVSPSAPLQTVDCTLGFGKAAVTVISPLGTGLEYRLDGGTYQTRTTFTSVSNGSHSITVRNSAGCITEGVGFSVSCGCVNPPTISLSGNSGSTCGTTLVTVGGNTFGGSATAVTITENGSGSVSPSSATTSPFSFTYTPEAGDAGKTVIITLTTNNPSGSPCTAAVATYTLVVNAVPATPSIGIITQPSCNVSTGSVALSDLPAGTWTLNISPGSITRSGSGLSTVISDLTEGTYTFTVTSSTGCTSASTRSVVINPQPVIPAAPIAGAITQPTCSVPTGSVIINGLPSTGIWILTRYPGTVTLTGTGPTTTISDLSTGIYNFTITNENLCTSIASTNVFISPQPSIPSAPVVGTITHPTCSAPAGQVILTGLPATGSWTLTRAPDGVTAIGTGTSTIITNLAEGTYTFTVKNSDGCNSVASSNVIINPKPATTPIIKITNPAPVCAPATVNLIAASITQGSTENLIYSYWRDSKATLPYNTPGTATEGTFYIKGTSTLGCFDIKPVIVKVFASPLAEAGPDQVLEYLFETTLEAADQGINVKGEWSVISGSGEFTDFTYARTLVRDLSVGDNMLLWTVSNDVCPSSRDSVKIIVQDLLIPTLITPNGDSKNEYFVIKALKALGRTELVIFDRWGARVYLNDNYDNGWNGVDYDGNPLPPETYFFGLKSEKGIYISGYIVIMR